MRNNSFNACVYLFLVDKFSPSFVCGIQISLGRYVQIIVFRQIVCPTEKGSNMNSR